MFMLPVSKAKALNIVVGRPCWKYGGANMLSFLNWLSMALRNKKDLDGMFVGFLGEESFKMNVIVYFVFVLSW